MEKIGTIQWRTLADGQVEVIQRLIKDKAGAESKAKSFIVALSLLTDGFLRGMAEDQFKAELKAIKELFDSFAVVDEFDSLIIMDCYNQIKISLMKWKCFADKTSNLSAELKLLFDHFYSIMKELYFQEIFGFFSTTLHPEDIPELNLPCKISCGCADGWQREPYLDQDGNPAYENVVRVQDPYSKELFCMTINDNPCLLEEHEKCSLSDEQIESVKNFIKKNKDIIILHNAAVIDSKDFISALKLRNSKDINKATYTIAFNYSVRFDSMKIPSKTYFVDMNDMSRWKAKRLFHKIKKEIDSDSKKAPENFGDGRFVLQRNFYKINMLKILKPSAMRRTCCFCCSVFKGYGNSTWPIYYEKDGEIHRCCDECNEKYVGAARSDRALIMQLREKFGIDYTEYKT